MRVWWRRLRLGLPTVTGLSPGGFFIPYRYAAGTRAQDYPALRPLFEAAGPAFSDTLAAIEEVAPDLLRIAEEGGPARFDQDWFPRLDAAAAYAIVRRHKPARIVEIGSGHSTRFLARAVADGGLETIITCIDPAPRAAIAGLGVRHIPALLRDAGKTVFADLAPGDILFVDSSHVAMAGTDVDRLFLDVVPRLPAGIFLHVHDITLPDAYPEAWAWRGYNEQLLVGALMQGGAFTPVFASHFVKSAYPLPEVVRRLPLQPSDFETSLWLRKVAAPISHQA
ncbi:class I SAM-dependent methyltransferase [Microvirga massiliensis]|uniref:class I SAM-dependent methyltransferase n=1 Tax=Microvirga massiliensis TaxID=1033741 RepID=UPI00062B46BD|nr:class I SAM-dependent methyltransferase [Microvirga massiliensis]